MRGLVRSAVVSALTALCLRPGALSAQQTPEQIRALRLEATPVGALPPTPLPMPASRNHNYWGFRVQAGHRRGRSGGPDLYSLASGVDWQLRGGSVFGATAGMQRRDCELPAETCGSHMLFGVRGRFGLITGGPSLGVLFGDHSANAVLGTELGFGFAPKVAPEVHACTVDVGVPISLSMLQQVRLVTFITPALAWNIDCSPAGPPNDVSFLTAFGVAIQQLGLRGLDVAIGFQKIFETDTGFHLGVTISYVKVR